MKFKILPIEDKHIKGYWDALDSVAKEHDYLSFLEGPSIESTMDFVHRNINDKWPHYVALDGEKIIGWCDITPLDRPIFKHIGSLGIALLAPYRGKGVGKAILEIALQAAKAKGLTRIELTVREKNKPAIKLYEKFGFVVEGVHKNGVCINGKYENHIFMALLYNTIQNVIS